MWWKYAWPGGGGWGDPKARDRDLVARDLEDGIISEHQARHIYGLEIRQEELTR